MAKLNPLGRIRPPDFEHVAKYPLMALAEDNWPTNSPVVLGVNWYENFDKPVLVGNQWFIGKDSKKLGSIRGGHSVCIKPQKKTDTAGWWPFYDQGREGACVGFASSRAMSLLNRTRYLGRWLWDRAKEVDSWTDTNPGDDNGTSVRAAMDILRNKGHVPWKLAYDNLDVNGRIGLIPSLSHGITTNRWATTVDEIQKVLSSPSQERTGAVPILNSWGTDYPHAVWMPYETLQRLLDEDGEASLITDR